MMTRRHIRRVVRARDKVVDAANALLYFRHVWRQVSSIDEHAGTRILEHNFGFAGNETEVEWHGDRAKNLASEVRRDRIFRRGHVERDAITWPHAEICQPLREAAHARVPLAVCPAAVFENERGMVRIAFRRLDENRRDVYGAKALSNSESRLD